jgi:hypothetical protein
MDDLNTSDTPKKLAILLPHLIQHNSEHAEDLEKWIKIAEEDGCGVASKEMKKAQSLMEKISEHLGKAAASICAGTANPAHDHHNGHHHEHHHDHDHHHDKDHDHPHHHPH